MNANSRVCSASSAGFLPFSTSPSVAIPGTDRQRRAFDFFCQRPGRFLADTLQLIYLYPYILQASHYDCVLRSAVISIGSLGERLQVNPVLTWENQQANDCHEFARVEYGRALRALQAHIDRYPHQSSILIATACLLFTAFEFLQNNVSASLAHLHGGWKILAKNNLGSASDLQCPNLCVDLEHEIKRTFTLLDNQLSFWLGLGSWSSPELIAQNHIDADAPNVHLGEFSTVEDASSSFIHILGEIFQKSRRPSPTCKLSNRSDFTTENVAVQRSLGKLRAWHACLQALRDKLGTSVDMDTQHRMLVMEMNCTSFLIEFGMWLKVDKIKFYCQKESDFRLVNSLATSIVLPVNEEVTRRMQRVVLAINGAPPDEVSHSDPAALFTLYVGIIPPLFMTATKCQNPQLRTEAIALLRTRPWREGAWDSVAMARVAEGRAA